MKLWAVFDGRGRLMDETVRMKRKDSIYAAATWQWRWDQLKQVGYRCKRITVTVEGES